MTYFSIGKPKQTNFLSCFQELLDDEELCPASYFSNFMLLNVIQNRTMKNSCRKHFLWNFLVSYVTICVCKSFLSGEMSLSKYLPSTSSGREQDKSSLIRLSSVIGTSLLITSIFDMRSASESISRTAFCKSKSPFLTTYGLAEMSFYIHHIESSQILGWFQNLILQGFCSIWFWVFIFDIFVNNELTTKDM